MKTLAIVDTELGEIESEVVDDVVKNIESELSTEEVKQEGDDNKLVKYEKAFEIGDIDTLEKIRLEHPEDARFNIHLQVLGIQPEQLQTFAEAKAEHDKMLKSMNYDGLPEFRRIVDSGNKKQAIEYIKSSIRKDHPLRRQMLRMIDFM